LGRRKLAAGDESDQRGDTVHVDTIVKRRISLPPEASPRRG